MKPDISLIVSVTSLIRQIADEWFWSVHALTISNLLPAAALIVDVDGRFDRTSCSYDAILRIQSILSGFSNDQYTVLPHRLLQRSDLPWTAQKSDQPVCSIGCRGEASSNTSPTRIGNCTSANWASAAWINESPCNVKSFIRLTVADKLSAYNSGYYVEFRSGSYDTSVHTPRFKTTGTASHRVSIW